MQLTINGVGIELSPSPAEVAALGERRALANEAIDAANEGKPEGEQREHHASDAAYLEWAVSQWAENNPDATEADILATAERALRSWAGTPPPEPPAPEELSPEAQTARLVAYAADKRWQKQTGGITVAGLPVRTDDKTRNELDMAKADAAGDAGWSTEWKLANGQWVTINGATVVVMCAAVSQHVRSCFALEKQVCLDIEAGAVTTTAEIDVRFA